MKQCLVALGVLLSVVFGGVSAQSPLKVVATFSILGDIVQNIGKDNIELTVLVGVDSDTHTYEPAPSDAQTLGQANLIVENGLGFETWLDALVASSGSQATRIVVSTGVLPIGIEVGTEIGTTDPHIWQNLYNTVKMVENVRDALVTADPANAVDYELNANAYLQQLLDLDTYILQQIQTIPPAQRQLVTNHDAFGYFANRYGLVVVGVAIDSVSGAEPSASDIATLIETIRNTGAPAIFAENIENADLATQIAQEANVTLGAPLCSDALTPADGVCPTVLAMMRYNVDSIVSALKP